MNYEELKAFAIEADAQGDTEAAWAAMQRMKSLKEPEQFSTEMPETKYGNVGNSFFGGLTAGMADEFSGAVGAIGSYLDRRPGTQGAFDGQSFLDRYRSIRDQTRADEAAFSDRNPSVALTAEIAGGLATGGVGASRLAGAKGMAQLGEAARAGGLLGAVSGAGYSEADSVEGVLTDTVQGGLLGAGTGALLPGAKRLYDTATSPQARAANRLNKLLKRDGVGADDLAQRLADQPDALVADVGGENVLRAAETVAQMPGRGAQVATEALEARQMGQADRISSLLDEAIGGADFHKARKALESTMKANSKPLYDQAYAESLQLSETMKGLMPRLKDDGILKAAVKKARLDGQITGGNMRVFDYAKREIDDRIGTAVRQGRGNDARIYRDLKETLVTEMDEQVPVYAQARAAYAGPKQLDSALEKGRKFLREDAESIEEALSGMAESEVEHFRIGALRALRDRVMGKSDTADSFKAIFSNPLMRGKIEALFPDQESFEAFAVRMGDEAQYFKNKTQILGNSATFRRQQGAEDLAADAMDLATMGNMIPGILRRGARYATRGTEARNEQVRGLLGDYLFSNTNPYAQGLLNVAPSPLDPRLIAPAALSGVVTQ